MRAIITVTESRSLPGTFTITCSARKNKNGVIYPAEARGAAGAAAKALEYAIDCREGYAIVAPENVSKHIPDDMRSRA